MPGMYANGEYDLAGFAVGAVDQENLLPYADQIQAGIFCTEQGFEIVPSLHLAVVSKYMQEN